MARTRKAKTAPFSDPLVPEGFETGSFGIATQNGTVEVDGLVRGSFGVDLREATAMESAGWVVTHLPSGKRVAARFTTSSAAATFIRRIESLTDWAEKEPEMRNGLRDEVVSALEEAAREANRFAAVE